MSTQLDAERGYDANQGAVWEDVERTVDERAYTPEPAPSLTPSTTTRVASKSS